LTVGGFVHEARTPRVVFGAGARVRLEAEAERAGLERLLAVCTPGRASLVAELSAAAGGRIVGIFDRARQHVPAADLQAARAAAGAARADGYLAFGGGSAIGFAKALALHGGQPIIALPTTYSGSEVTPVWGITDSGRKMTGRDERVLPWTVIYDAELTLSFPPEAAAASGMNAIAHCAEALYAPDANPLTSLHAEEGIRFMSAALPAIVRSPRDMTARSDALYGAWLSGLALGAVRMGIQHRLAHLLGGSFGLPHAETHAVLLPYTMWEKVREAPDALHRMARALGADDATTGLHALSRRIGAPESLRSIGMRAEQVAQAAALAVATERDAGEPRSETALYALLDAAWAGRPPQRGSGS
jgi:maleylacetate reductase